MYVGVCVCVEGGGVDAIMAATVGQHGYLSGSMASGVPCRLPSLYRAGHFETSPWAERLLYLSPPDSRFMFADMALDG